MKQIKPAVRGIAAFALIAASAACAAQNTPPPPPPDAGPVAGPGAISAPPAPLAPLAPPPSATDAAGAERAATLSGVVQRFLINPEGDIDGLLLADNALVRFPPHLGADVTASIAPGDRVSVTGFMSPGGTLQAREMMNAKTHHTVVDQPPRAGLPPPPRALAGVGLVRLDASGRVLRVTTAPRGEPDGVLLTDGTAIRLTPPVAAQFPALLQPGTTIAAQGYGTRNRYGASLQATAFGTPGNLTVLYTNLRQ